ncbi:MAG: hypothetical protein ABW152_14935 [Candidatus Thiodiazotropha endolucinida]
MLHNSGGNLEYEVRYPSDPDLSTRLHQGQLYFENVLLTVYQRNDPLYIQSRAYIDSNTIRDGVLGAVDINVYDNWLNQNRGVDVLY